jgi:hypothetical protein
LDREARAPIDRHVAAQPTDARRFILNEPEHIQKRSAWQRAAELSLHAAEDASQAEAATRQVEVALVLKSAPEACLTVPGR